MSALAATHLISPKHISMDTGAWLKLERSHTAGSSLELGVIARSGLVGGGDAHVGGVGDVPGLCVGDGVVGCSDRAGGSTWILGPPRELSSTGSAST